MLEEIGCIRSNHFCLWYISYTNIIAGPQLKKYFFKLDTYLYKAISYSLHSSYLSQIICVKMPQTKQILSYLLVCLFVCLLSAIWNNVNDYEGEQLNSLCPGQCFSVSFTEDSMWEDWAKWVLQRCEVSSSEKLVPFLQKVCDISIRTVDSRWAKAFYMSLKQLIRSRIEQCLDEDMQRNLEKFEAILT